MKRFSGESMAASPKPYDRMKDSGVEWLGEVPVHWSVGQVKRHYAIQLGKMLQPRPRNPQDGRVQYLKARNVQWFGLDTSDLDSMYASANEIGQYGVNMGDLLVCEGGEGGRCALATGTQDIEPCIIQNALHRVRPYFRLGEQAGRNDYLQFILNAVSSSGWFDALNDKATIAHFTAEKFGALPIPMPPFAEQTAIARFLDHATSCIDRYIRAKESLIALLDECRQTLIHQAVTNGVDSEPTVVSTGNSWFPIIPVDWKVLPMRRVIHSAVDGPHHSPNYVDKGIPFLSARNIKTNCWSLGDIKHISSNDYESFCQRVKPELGDVLYTKGGTTGIARVVDLNYPFQVWVHVAVLKVRNDLVVPEYLALALNSKRCYEQSQLLTRGATNQDLGLGRMKDIVLTVPPLSVQRKIVAHVNSVGESISSGSQSAARLVQLLKECRTQLISDVVTGKLDVRGAAAALPDTNLVTREDGVDTIQAESHSHRAEHSVAEEANA